MHLNWCSTLCISSATRKQPNPKRALTETWKITVISPVVYSSWSSASCLISQNKWCHCAGLTSSAHRRDSGIQVCHQDRASHGSNLTHSAVNSVLSGPLHTSHPRHISFQIYLRCHSHSRTKTACDSEHLLHRKAISQLAWPGWAKPPSSETLSKTRHHFSPSCLYHNEEKFNQARLEKNDNMSCKNQVRKRENTLQGKKNQKPCILVLLLPQASWPTPPAAVQTV